MALPAAFPAARVIESRRIDVQEPLLTEMPLSGAESAFRPAAGRRHANYSADRFLGPINRQIPIGLSKI